MLKSQIKWILLASQFLPSNGTEEPRPKHQTNYIFTYPSEGSYVSSSDVIKPYVVLSSPTGSTIDAIDAVVLRVAGNDLERNVLFTPYEHDHFRKEHFREETDEDGRRVVVALNPRCKHSNFKTLKARNAEQCFFGNDPQFMPEGEYIAEAWLKTSGNWINKDLKEKTDRYQELTPAEIERVRQECETTIRTKFTVDKTSPTGRVIETTLALRIRLEDNVGFNRRALIYKLTDNGVVDITKQTAVSIEIEGTNMIVELKNYPCSIDDLFILAQDKAGNTTTFAPKMTPDELERRLKTKSKKDKTKK